MIRSRMAAELGTTWQTYWPILLCACLLATGIPWYFDGPEEDLRPVLRILLTGGVVVFVMARLVSGSANALIGCLPYVASVLLLAVVWHALGALNAPFFLILFVLPVLSVAQTSNGWIEYFVAATAVLCVVAVVLAVHPDARSWLEHLSYYPDALRGGVAADDAYGAPISPDTSVSALLGGFAISVFAVASISHLEARARRQLESRLDAALRAQREAAELASDLLRKTDTLELVVNPATGVVVKSNADTADDAHRKTILEVLDPVYPEDLRRLIEAPRPGRSAAKICRPGGEAGVFDIEVQPVRLDDEDLRRVSVGKTKGEDLVVRALYELDIALLLLSPDRRILLVTRNFARVFPDAVVGSSAEHALNSVYGLPVNWWDIAPASRSNVRFDVGDRGFKARVRVSGAHEAGGLTFVHLVPRESP